MDDADKAQHLADMDDARLAGQQARRRGDSRNTCPYSWDEPEAAAWCTGWDQEDDVQRRVTA